MSGLEKTIQLLNGKLKGPLPGLKAQLKMVTDPRPGNIVYYEVDDTSIKAGVLVLLYPLRNRLHLVLTRRTNRVDLHQAQISFPGGRQEEGESPEQAAIREAHEEVNVLPRSVQILGKLTPLYIPPSNYCIYPIVATTNKRPDFKPSLHEVDEVIEVPMDHLLDPKNVHKEVWTIRGDQALVPFYLFKGQKIWGATAMVLAELVEIFE
ncbi:MAG: CoA pyrophosphatase [Candidatus Aminicenantes bacterium]|nr:MAG: CoA pyrophosphatase [Candidatus Aminicenantes bacterium]